MFGFDVISLTSVGKCLVVTNLGQRIGLNPVDLASIQQVAISPDAVRVRAQRIHNIISGFTLQSKQCQNSLFAPLFVNARALLSPLLLGGFVVDSLHSPPWRALGAWASLFPGGEHPTHLLLEALFFLLEHPCTPGLRLNTSFTPVSCFALLCYISSTTALHLHTAFTSTSLFASILPTKSCHPLLPHCPSIRYCLLILRRHTGFPPSFTHRRKPVLTSPTFRPRLVFRSAFCPHSPRRPRDLCHFQIFTTSVILIDSIIHSSLTLVRQSPRARHGLLFHGRRRSSARSRFGMFDILTEIRGRAC